MNDLDRLSDERKAQLKGLGYTVVKVAPWRYVARHNGHSVWKSERTPNDAWQMAWFDAARYGYVDDNEG